HVAGQANAESFQSGEAFPNQNEPHPRFLSKTAALIDATTLSLGTQRDRRHQAGNASAENRYVHWPNPGECRFAIYQGATPLQPALLTRRTGWAFSLTALVSGEPKQRNVSQNLESIEATCHRQWPCHEHEYD